MEAIAEGTITWERDPDFGYEVATAVPGIEDPELLQPRLLYERTGRADEYRAWVERLKRERAEFLAGFPGLRPEILAAVSARRPTGGRSPETAVTAWLKPFRLSSSVGSAVDLAPRPRRSARWLRSVSPASAAVLSRAARLVTAPTPRVVVPAFEADPAERRVADRDPDPQPQLVARAGASPRRARRTVRAWRSAVRTAASG